MGHTVPPFTWQYQKEKAYFAKFRRALLLADDKRTFDDIWNRAEFHLPAAEKTSHPLPIATILMMISLEQQKTIQQLQRQCDVQALKIIQLEQALHSSEAQRIYLMKELQTIESTIEDRLKDFREEMLAIKYPEYDFAP